MMAERAVSRTVPRRLSPEDCAICIEKLTKRYPNGVVALKGIDLAVEPGDVVGYLGPNGAGKTTTMKILTSMIKPTSGKAYINGVDIEHCPKRALKHVGALIEVPGVYEYLTPVEFLTYSGRIYGMDRHAIPARIDEVLAIVMLRDWKRKKIGSFSTGMTRRLILAQTILHNPEILILDEPGLGLDPKGMADIRNIIKNLQTQGKTIFLSSHLLHEVRETCNKIILLNKGRVMVQGPVEELTHGSKLLRIELRFLKPLSVAQVTAIRQFEGVEKFETHNASGTVMFAGGREASAGLLHSLIHAAIPLTMFTPSETSLEDLYISIIGEEGGIR